MKIIVITKCDVPHHWYAKLIGKEFEVRDKNTLTGSVTVHYEGHDWLIPKGDYKYL